MSRNPTPAVARCDGLDRRDFLHLGCLSAFGLSLAGLPRLQARADEAAPARAASRRERSCLLIWLDGGPSHLDLFDPKPDAPVEVRSPFATLPTPVAGVHFTELLPRSAKLFPRFALIRSLTHELGDHDTGTRFLLTGHRPTPALEHPSLGSIVAWESRGGHRVMPPYVAIPGDAVGGQSNAVRSGFLPGAYSPFNAGGQPGKVPDLDLPEGVTLDRLDRRRDMLARLNTFAGLPEQDTAVRNRHPWHSGIGSRRIRPPKIHC
ncbi:MAG: DUF1501 domain-containing protein [Verrucomicrobiota bacterium]